MGGVVVRVRARERLLGLAESGAQTAPRRIAGPGDFGATRPGPLSIRVFDGGRQIAQSEVLVDDGAHAVTVPLPAVDRAGLSIEVTSPTGRATTAIDVAPHWSSAPRYGFFSDFGPDEPEAESIKRADALLRLHVNVVQFYDWMASHHSLVADADEFTDPLGRRLSHVVGRRKVDLAHERGMAALGYGALYGAEAEFSLERPDWLLYDGRRQPLTLADIFYLQDFSTASPWRDWIEAQYESAVDNLGFDGIHIDQYGFPSALVAREWYRRGGARQSAPSSRRLRRGGLPADLGAAPGRRQHLQSA